ncbi:MAG: PilZ domain-containing protein [Planctomycetota bacterium]|nr:PilZ domain-containing protein [Planctomycetota bacterium]
MSHWTHGKNTYVDSVRLSRTQFAEILEDLERSRSQAPDGNRRKGDRQACSAVAGVLLEIEHPGGVMARFIVRPRDISRTGVGFVHGGFVYKGSKVIVTLVMLDREMIVLRGTVVRCRHLKARIHEIGMRFNEPLKADPFAVPAEAEVEPAPAKAEA